MTSYPKAAIFVLLSILLLGLVALISLREIARTINVKENTSDIVVLIPEGFTLEKIQESLDESGIAGAGRLSETAKPERWAEEFPFLKIIPGRVTTLEGFLFPDTYRFEKHDTAEAVVRKFLKNFEEKTKGLGVTYKTVTLASILEREVPVKDMSLAAGVLLHRLNAGVPLQADATLVYALGRPITASDPETLDSPYNTYRYLGLPPTPISNPGLEAIKAALNPAASEYWYYLSRRDNGETIFSATLEEHNAARAKYLR